MTREENIYDKVAWIALLVLAFLTPLLISVIPSSSSSVGVVPFGGDIYEGLKYYVLGIGVSLVCAMWAVSAFVKKRPIRYTTPLLLLLLYVLWACVCGVLSDYQLVSLLGWEFRQDGIIATIVYALLVFLVIQFAQDKTRMRAVVTAVCASSVVVAVYGLLQAAGIDFIHIVLSFEFTRSFSTFGNPDMLGGFLAITTLASLGLALSEKKDLYRYLYWGAFVLNIWCLVLTFTRGAWLGAVIGLVLFVAVAAIKRMKLRRSDWVCLAIAVLVVASAVLISLSNPLADTNAGDRIGEVVSSDSNNVSARFELWKTALAVIGESPIIGHGPDTYPLIAGQYQTEAGAKAVASDTLMNNPHNYYLLVAAGTGIVGAILLVAFLAWTAFVSGKAILSRELSDTSTLMLGLWCGCASFLAFCLTGVATVGSLFVLWLFLGLLLVPGSRPVKRELPKWSHFLVIPIVILCACLAIFFGWLFIGDWQMSRVGTTENTVDAIMYADQAIQTNPERPVYSMLLAGFYIEQGDAATDRYMESGKRDKGDLATADTNYEEAARILEEVRRAYPGYYASYSNLATLYNKLAEATDDTSWAEKALAVAQEGEKVQAYDPLFPLEEARAYLTLGEPEKSQEVLDRALEIEPDNDYAAQIRQALNESTKAPATE